ncbi:MAG: hypothetical protein CIT01_07865 [Methanobacterium sp. BRmetb2]|jgi:Zn finger protein HypA/HybF involved in hydrogenase expression|nr:MAG: hypothetical protein CIT01_07865 [Methanobacterium sp. BRmetb2]
MALYNLDEIPETIKCSKCGKESKEIEGSYQHSVNFVLIDYKCCSCGNIERRQYGKPVGIID